MVTYSDRLRCTQHKYRHWLWCYVCLVRVHTFLEASDLGLLSESPGPRPGPEVCGHIIIHLNLLIQR